MHAQKFIYLDDTGEGSLLVGVRVKRSDPSPLGPAALPGITGLLLTNTGESQVTEPSEEISITSSLISNKRTELWIIYLEKRF